MPYPARHVFLSSLSRAPFCSRRHPSLFHISRKRTLRSCANERMKHWVRYNQGVSIWWKLPGYNGFQLFFEIWKKDALLDESMHLRRKRNKHKMVQVWTADLFLCLSQRDLQIDLSVFSGKRQKQIPLFFKKGRSFLNSAVFQKQWEYLFCRFPEKQRGFIFRRSHLHHRTQLINQQDIDCSWRTSLYKWKLIERCA